MLTDAAAKPLAPEARKRTTGAFADEDSLFNSFEWLVDLADHYCLVQVVTKEK